MLELKQHQHSTGLNSKVWVDLIKSDIELTLNFVVETPALNANSNFQVEGWKNWGLWEHDVVEVFIQKASEENHYLELQISPLSQKFALLVKRPRAEFLEIESLATTASAHMTDRGFNASFKIIHSDIPGDGEIRLNCHACLGKKEARSYFALNPNVEEKPDFHRPANFLALEDL